MFYSNNGYYRKRKKTISQLSQQRLIRGKALHQNLGSDRFKRPLKVFLTESVQGEIKYCNFKNVKFKKKGAKVKNIAI